MQQRTRSVVEASSIEQKAIQKSGRRQLLTLTSASKPTSIQLTIMRYNILILSLQVIQIKPWSCLRTMKTNKIWHSSLYNSLCKYYINLFTQNDTTMRHVMHDWRISIICIVKVGQGWTLKMMSSISMLQDQLPAVFSYDVHSRTSRQ